MPTDKGKGSLVARPLDTGYFPDQSRFGNARDDVRIAGNNQMGRLLADGYDRPAVPRQTDAADVQLASADGSFRGNAGDGRAALQPELVV